MIKLFWSAFALSLMLSQNAFTQIEGVEDFLGFETEIAPELAGKQKWTPSNLHQNPEMQVSEIQVEVDKTPLKGQSHSLIKWDEMDTEAWMNVNFWIKEREIKDKNADWKLRLRDIKQNELMGKLLSCSGTCHIYRGTNFATGSHLSRFEEGDELKTQKDSVAWVYLMDGTLLRVGPESSVSLLEVNFTKDQAFLLIRLNEGHVFWHSRKRELHKVDTSPETDSASLPLMVREANQQFFERKIYQGQLDQQHMNAIINLDDDSIKEQYKKINEYLVSNNESFNFTSRVMIVTPNATLKTQNQSLDVVYLPAGKTYFKKRESEKVTLELRGYLSEGRIPIIENKWVEIDSSGKNYALLSDPPAELQIVELLTKRIRSFELAREIWLKEFTFPIIAMMNDPKALAINFGYALWEDELEERINFLHEYTRRIETTNLKSIETLSRKLEREGQKINKELSQIYYQKTLNHYLMGLKVRYTSKKMQVREMNDLQYYVWILRHGKF